MTNLDDLFTEINDKEIIDNDTIKIDNSRQTRIEQIVMLKINSDTSNKNTKHIPKKKKLVFILAACMIFLLMACAVVQQNDWDIVLLNYLGISNADTKQLEGGSVDIGVSDKKDGITVKAVSSIGDKNTAYIRIETDYKLPKECYKDENTKIVFEDYSLKVSTSKTLEHLLGSGYSSGLTPIENNGYLSFILDVTCDDINRQKVTIELGNLYLEKYSPDRDEIEKKTLIVKGPWTLTWKFNYQSKARTYYPFKFVKQGSEHILITKMELTPISLKITALKNPFNRKNTEGNLIGKSRLTLNNDKEIELNGASTGILDNCILTSYENLYTLGGVLNTNEIDSITIANRKIIISSRYKLIKAVVSITLLIIVIIIALKIRKNIVKGRSVM